METRALDKLCASCCLEFFSETVKGDMGTRRVVNFRHQNAILRFHPARRFVIVRVFVDGSRSCLKHVQ